MARALSLEEGKILPEAKGEVQKTLKYLEFAAGDARRINGITAESELPGTFAFTIWRPHGVVGLITPWNFPVCIPLWKLAPALITGNTVVLKPSDTTPQSTLLLAEVAAEWVDPETGLTVAVLAAGARARAGYATPVARPETIANPRRSP